MAKGYCYHVEVSQLPSFFFTGLAAETAYCVQVAPWNDTAPLQWSTAVTHIVQ